MLDKIELETNLAYFRHRAYHRWSACTLICLDRWRTLPGRTAGAYWLMDLCSYQRKLRQHVFQVWTLTVNPDDHTALAVCDDGNGKTLARQKIPFTDFPLDTIKLYAIWSDETGWLFCCH
jgi:hypothetical protein